MTFLLNPFIGGGVIELARDTTLYQDTTALTTYTSDARAVGAAQSDREVYALIVAYSTSSSSISSVTIGGVTATSRGVAASATNMKAYIYSANVPTGTTAVVVATFSANLLVFSCAVIALANLGSTTPFDVEQVTEASGDTDITTGAAFDLPAGGYAMAVACNGNLGATGSASWTGLTETIDEVLSPSGNKVNATMAYQSVGSNPQTGATVTATLSGSSLSAKALVAISVR